jgi:hypothetical protein
VKIGLLLLVTSVIALSGCTALRKVVNNKFPPIDENQQRQIAIDSTAKALSAIKTPTILAEIKLSEAGQVLLNEELRKLGVTKLSLVGTHQLLKISLEFDHKFSEKEAGENAEGRKFITTWRPEASGSIVIFAGLKNPDISAINLADIPAMDLQLLPALSTVQVNDLKVVGHYKVTLLVQPLVALLNAFKDNVSGILARSKLASISIPEVAKRPFNLDKSFSFQIDQQKVNATISANPIPVPDKLTGIAWRIADDKLTVVMQVLPRAAIDLPANPIQPATFKAIDDRFNDLLKTEFDLSIVSDTELVAVNEGLIANTLAGAVEQAAPCVAISAPAINIPPLDKMISIPPDSANCRQDPTDCEFRCQHNHADDHCGKLNAPCKIAEAAKNVAFDAEFGTCMGAREAKIVACRTGQAATQAGCETAKTAFNAALAGEVGDVTAQVSGNVNAQVCLSRFALSDHLASVNLDLDASGKANGNVAFGFSPRRGLGRAICVLNLNLNNGFTAGISAPGWSGTSPVSVKQVGEDVYVSYDLQGKKVTASYSPTLPTLLMHDLPKIDLTCPVVGAAANIVDVGGFLAGIPNQFQLQVPSIKGLQVIPLPKLSIGEQKVKMTLRPLTDKAIIVEGRLER